MKVSVEHWVEFLVGTAIFGALAILLANVFTMKGDLSGVREKVDQTDLRVTRIADVLPDVRARVAWEEIQAPISGFVAVSYPVETSVDEWTSSIRVYSAHTGEIQKFQVTSSESDKDAIGYLVAGRIRADGLTDPSFHELAMFSNRERIPITLPPGLDTRKSFVIRSQNVDTYAEFLRKFADDDGQVTKEFRAKNWVELAEEIERIVDRQEQQ